VEAIDVLNRESEWQISRDLGWLQAVQRFDHGRAVVPRHLGRSRCEVFAVCGRDRDELLRRDAELGQKRAELGLDRIEPLVAIADQVHLVDQNDDLLNSEQLYQESMPARLLLDALGGIDEEQSSIRAG